MKKDASLACNAIRFAAHANGEQLIDLSSPYYEIANLYNSATYSNLFDVALRENSEVNAMVALEHDKIVAEYYDEGFHSSRKFDLWSGTKACTSLLLGVMEQEGLIHVHDTLEDIFRMHPFGTLLVMPIIERTLRSNTFFKCVQDSQCQSR